MSNYWPFKKLNEICDVSRGKTITRKKAVEGDVPVVAGGINSSYSHNIANRPANVITVSGSGANAGFVNFWKIPIFASDCSTILPLDSNDLDVRYVYYAMLNLQEYISKELRKGSAQPHVYAKDLALLEIPVPPLEEQIRIVGVLDEAFINISNSTSQLEIRVQDAKELFLSSVENFFKKQGNTWEEPTLLELLERGWITSHLDGNHGGDYPRKSEFIDEGVRYISANCIRNETVDLTNSKFLSPERAARLRKGIAQDGDVLFAHNATVGPVAILRTNESKIILGTSLTYYRCNPEHIIPEYLAHYMRSYRFTIQYSQVMRQSTRNQVPITKQREFTHLIPPIELQSTMAKKFDALQKETMKLEKKYLQELTSYYELKQSILQDAFTGKLTGGIAA